MADVLAEIRAELDRRLHRAARLLMLEHRKDLGRSHPPASKRGEFPAARTGDLMESVSLRSIPGGYRVYYDGTAPYLLWLVARGRKSLHDTAARVAPQLASVIRGV